MTSDGSTITSQDVADLNRATVERAAWVCRVAGTVLVVVGVVGAIGWCWTEVRYQQQLSPLGFPIGDGVASPSAGAVDRIDLFMSSVGLIVSAALVAGVGLAMRLAADYAQTRVGSSITGYQVGDDLDDVDGPVVDG